MIPKQQVQRQYASLLKGFNPQPEIFTYKESEEDYDELVVFNSNIETEWRIHKTFWFEGVLWNTIIYKEKK